MDTREDCKYWALYGCILPENLWAEEYWDSYRFTWAHIWGKGNYSSSRSQPTGASWYAAAIFQTLLWPLQNGSDSGKRGCFLSHRPSENSRWFQNEFLSESVGAVSGSRSRHIKADSTGIPHPSPVKWLRSYEGYVVWWYTKLWYHLLRTPSAHLISLLSYSST